MPIVLRETFDVREEVYSDFIHRYHGRILDLLNQFHGGVGVVGPLILTNATRWSAIKVTNNIGRSIEIITSLESLWLYGYRRLSDENSTFPWRLISGYTHEGSFSSLPGQHESLGFDGKYTSSTSTLNVSRPALNNAITVLDNYAHTPANSDKASDCFLVIVLYFAEALRIKPIRDLLCNNFVQHKQVQVGIFHMRLARGWHTLSGAFLSGSYSSVASSYEIHNTNDLKENLWLLYNKWTPLHLLDGVRDSRPGDPGNGDETGPRDSIMGGYSGDGGPKRSGGQGGSKNKGGQPRDQVASSRSRRPRVGRGRSGNLASLPLSHDLVILEIVNLADELLPSLPQGTISLPVSYSFLIRGISRKSPAASSSKQDESSVTNETSTHEKLLEEQPELRKQFGMDLLPILKSFLAGILAWKDPQVLIPALQIAETLIEKLPGIFSKMFVKGVVHAIESLICQESSSATPNQVPSTDNDSDALTGTSSRSGQYRRRASGPRMDSTNLDKAKTSPPASGSTDTSGSSSSLRVVVSGCAKSYKEKYFPGDSDSSDVGVTDHLRLLRTLWTKLNACAENSRAKGKGKLKVSAVGSFDISAGIEEQLNEVVAEMLTELNKGDGVSTFEFIGSRAVIALYLSCGTFGKEKIPDNTYHKLRQQAIRWYKSFISIALRFDKDGSGTPMMTLVHKLQNALSSLEQFPVVLSQSGRSSSSGRAKLSFGLSALSQPFKLHPCQAQGEKSLRNYSSNVVLIDPLANLAAVEDFLWPRIQCTESSSTQKPSTNSESGSASAGPAATALSGSGPVAPCSTRYTTLSVKIGGGTSGKDSQEASGSVNTSSSKGKGKAVLKPSSEEPKGLQTINAARRKAASEKDTEMKPAHDNSSSEEDNELDASPVEIDDALMIDEDDTSEDEDDDHDDVLRDSSLRICVPEMVHDWELGDPAEDSNPASYLNNSQSQPPPSGTSARNTRSRPDPADLCAMSSVFGSRGMSFAAAAMAGLAYVSGCGIRGSSQDHHGLGLGGSSSEHNNSLTFTAGGRQLSKNLTIYQAIQRQLVHDEEDDERFGGSDLPNDGSRFRSDIFTITYQRADGSAAQGGSGSASSEMKSKSGPSRTGTDGRGQQVSLLDSLLLEKLPCDMERSNPTYNILALLRVLEGLNQLAPCLRVQAVCDDFAEGRVGTLDELYNTGGRVPHEDFVNNKLTPKLSRQIQDVLALCSRSLPSWCYQLTKSCPFLLPFETRHQYFYSTAFGLSRALHRLQQQQSADNTNSSSVREVRAGQLQRQKVCMSRNRILDSAAKVMEMFSSQKAVLEVEYFGEVGTGLGPTLEFYTLLSHDLQKASLGLWQSSSNFEDSSVMETDLGSDGKKPGVDLTGRSNDLVRAPLGLFPYPWSVNADMSEGSQFYKVMEYFRLTGRVMAKALQDGRLLDLPPSTASYKLVLGQELDLHDILSFGKFGKILQELQILVHCKKYLELTGDSTQAIDDLRFHGAPIEDLCLDFTLPGYPGYVHKEGEESTSVNIDNLEEYISLVVDATVKMGIAWQMEAFRTGFNQVFDIPLPQIFSPHELDYLICGHRELWEAETLIDHIEFDDGYPSKSPVIVNLLEIMAEFSPEQQHAFCQFVTGAPWLPPGGLAALSPKLTIVRKHPSNVTSTRTGTGATESADEDLPSVMTCANYLKLPPYSTKVSVCVRGGWVVADGSIFIHSQEVMYKKLLYAINEGQGSFNLS